MTTLSSSLTAGALNFKNRVVMAPLTRCRADENRVPTDLMVEYYRQRASAGMILTEATSVTAMGVGYPNTPGIWSDEQVAGWKKITDAVHAEGGLIVLQLWHVGRISDPVYLNDELPVAPSAVAAAGHVSLIRPEKAYVTPRALETDEIPGVIEAFRKGAENAKKAGFDGVEIHGANGYLLEQFLATGVNLRTDQYGGSVENRARLMLEITDAVVGVWGAERVGMHLSPRSDAHDNKTDDRENTYLYVARELGKRKLAFICAREGEGDDSLGPRLKDAFGGVYIANESFTGESAAALIERGAADAVAFGKDFIANPDLPHRLAQGAVLNEQDPSTFYASGKEGYTTYPALKSSAA
ncbi:alkene reductase [Pokkaliibacter sp. CJK22405]|uniref:alkene reductase n=1 Tax=Pokkaliibacter sp. CJK22405 TaxID=3384615 RepID=UPI00398499EA